MWQQHLQGQFWQGFSWLDILSNIVYARVYSCLDIKWWYQSGIIFIQMMLVSSLPWKIRLTKLKCIAWKWMMVGNKTGIYPYKICLSKFCLNHANIEKWMLNSYNDIEESRTHQVWCSNTHSCTQKRHSSCYFRAWSLGVMKQHWFVEESWTR